LKTVEIDELVKTGVRWSMVGKKFL